MDALDIGRIVLGLVVLVGGGELLVRGASGLAARWGLSPLVVGLTVVAIGTSAPEFAVTVGAVLRDESDLAVGNVVGSNIANVLLVLGLAAIVLPLAVKRQLVRFDVPVMIVLSIVFLVCAFDGVISTTDAMLLLALWLIHTASTIVLSRREAESSNEGSDEASTPKVLTCLLLLFAGIALLVVGANQLVTGAVNIATSLGVDGLVIGLTVVAVGTSLPELVTSLVAAIRGERDIAIGNVVGSCIANIGLVLAVPAFFANGGISVAPAAISLDIPLMVAAALAVLPIVFTGFTVQRWEGALFVALYLAYTAYLVLNATAHDALTGFSQTMVFLVLPLIALTVVATVIYDLHRRTASAAIGNEARSASEQQD